MATSSSNMSVEVCDCLVTPTALLGRAAEFPQAVPQRGTEIVFNVIYFLQAGNALADLQDLWCRLRFVRL